MTATASPNSDSPAKSSGEGLLGSAGKVKRTLVLINTEVSANALFGQSSSIYQISLLQMMSSTCCGLLLQSRLPGSEMA